MKHITALNISRVFFLIGLVSGLVGLLGAIVFLVRSEANTSLGFWGVGGMCLFGFAGAVVFSLQGALWRVIGMLAVKPRQAPRE